MHASTTDNTTYSELCYPFSLYQYHLPMNQVYNYLLHWNMLPSIISSLSSNSSDTHHTGLAIPSIYTSYQHYTSIWVPNMIVELHEMILNKYCSAIRSIKDNNIIRSRSFQCHTHYHNDLVVIPSPVVDVKKDLCDDNINILYLHANFEYQGMKSSTLYESANENNHDMYNNEG